MENRNKIKYNNPYMDNIATIYMYKSNRKNAKIIHSFNICHLIAEVKGNRKINDDSILNQFVNTIDEIIHYSKQYSNKHLELSCTVAYGKKISYINANNEKYNDVDTRYYNFSRKEFSSLENCINFIYDIYTLIYPYNTLSLENHIYNNHSIKYMIKEYYSNK